MTFADDMLNAYRPENPGYVRIRTDFPTLRAALDAWEGKLTEAEIGAIQTIALASWRGRSFNGEPPVVPKDWRYDQTPEAIAAARQAEERERFFLETYRRIADQQRPLATAENQPAKHCQPAPQRPHRLSPLRTLLGTVTSLFGPRSSDSAPSPPQSRCASSPPEVER